MGFHVFPLPSTFVVRRHQQESLAGVLAHLGLFRDEPDTTQLLAVRCNVDLQSSSGATALYVVSRLKMGMRLSRTCSFKVAVTWIFRGRMGARKRTMQRKRTGLDLQMQDGFGLQLLVYASCSSWCMRS